jgi:hypothetical protein
MAGCCCVFLRWPSASHSRLGYRSLDAAEDPPHGEGRGREGAARVRGGPARAGLLPVPRAPGDGGAEGGAPGRQGPLLRRRRRHPVRAHPLARLRRPVPLAARPQGDHRVLRAGRLISFFRPAFLQAAPDFLIDRFFSSSSFANVHTVLKIICYIDTVCVGNENPEILDEV